MTDRHVGRSILIGWICSTPFWFINDFVGIAAWFILAVIISAAVTK